MEDDPFLREIAATERPAGRGQVSIARLVAKYITPGMPLQDALHYLKARGFKAIESSGKHVPLGQRQFVAKKFKRYQVLLTEETRVIFETSEDKVVAARGWLYLHGI